MPSRGIFIGLGANVPSPAGSPAETIRAALRELDAEEVRLEAVSRLYRNPAWPNPHDPPFVNAVARIQTTRSPVALMQLLHALETRFARTRSDRNGPRSLDLDLLDYGGRVEEGPPHLPHPRMSGRAFVLVPLVEIEPDWTHPDSGRPIAELLATLPQSDRDSVVAMER